MSELGKVMMYNLELSRELYSEVERRKFYVGYEHARTDFLEVEQMLRAHRRRKKDAWKFWKRQDPEWQKQHAALTSQRYEAHDKLRQMANDYPLLAGLYRFKYRPLRGSHELK